MKELHLIKAAQVKPFVELLNRYDAPVQQYSRQVGLPLDLVVKESGVIGEYCAWQFVELAAERERDHFFGYDAAQLNPITKPSDLGGFYMRNAPDLKTLLDYFIEDAKNESTGTFYRLRIDKDSTWFSRQQMFGKQDASWQVEQYMVAVFIQIIRICAGKNWLPEEIRFSSTEQPKPLPYEWTDCRAGWGYQETEIKIPNKIMTLPPLDSYAFKNNENNDISTTSFSELNIIKLIQSQVYTKQLNLESIADQTGLSAKTIKRRLQKLGTSFSDIIETTRINTAKQELKDCDKPVSLIADEMGYQHAANFTRAFKRLCGVTPQQYRNTHQN